MVTVIFSFDFPAKNIFFYFSINLHEYFKEVHAHGKVLPSYCSPKAIARVQESVYYPPFYCASPSRLSIRFSLMFTSRQRVNRNLITTNKDVSINDNEHQDSDWDIWLRVDINAAQRECVVPEVSRVFHFGLTGAHVRGAFTQAHFAGHLATVRPNIVLQGVDK